MKPNDDPTADIYKLMDQAGLSGHNIMDTRRPMAKIVNEMRTQLAAKVVNYILERDKHIFKQGAKSKEPQKIEVK